MTELERLQALCEEQRKQIENYQGYVDVNKELVKNFEELVKVQDARIEELQAEAKKWKQLFANTQWIAIYEFLTLFTESKGEILNSRYVRSSFEHIGITLNEETIIGMADHAMKHFVRDIEWNKQQQAKASK